MFVFAQEVFPEGQEILILVTELTINYYSAKFISQYGCNEYFQHKWMNLQKGLAILDKYLLTYLPEPDVASVEIPQGVTQIVQEAFAKCTSVQSISVPDSVKYIGKRAFY